MKTLVRRLIKVGLCLVAIAVVATVSAYLGRNFTGIGPVPDRTSFGRRLEGTQDGDARRFRFFYATNRSTDPANEPFDGDGRSVSQDITVGTYDVRISQGLYIKAWAWNDEDLVELTGRTELSRDHGVTQLRDAVAASPHQSLLVIVWGFRERFHTAAIKTAYTAFVLDINTPVFLFDWPGNQGEGPTGYLASQQMANESGPALGQVMTQIVRESGARRIWLMGSSLGCQTICEAFAWMMKQPNLADADQEIEHVVLSAPDVAAREFDERFAEEIKALSKYLTVYVASNDRALLVSKFVNRSQRLGRPDVAKPPASGQDDPQLQCAVDLLGLQDIGARNYSVVDATPVNRTRNLHHFFTDSPEYFDDLYRHLLDPDDPTSRCLYSVRTDRGTSFWILWDQ